MASGFGAIWTGRVRLGLPLVVWSTLAFYGLVTVIELVAHFLRTPYQSPEDKSFVRHVIGLAFGWLAVFGSVFGVVTRSEYSEWWAYATVYSISLIPTALVLTLWLWVMRSRSRVANSEPHTDTLASVVLEQTPSARAGERGRYTAP